MSYKNTFKIKYPKNSGFAPSSIFFLSGEPDLTLAYGKNEIAKKQTLFVTDTNISKLDCVKNFLDYAAKNGAKTLILEAGEKFKTIESVLTITRTALDADFNRNSRFVAIGGGVLCDMTAFAASIFKRGVAVEFVPTTLLADVDAALGGKTGCDFDSYKNMIGAFYPAEKLYIWPEFIKYLPEKEFRSGLAEAIKTAFLFDTKLTKTFEENSDKVLQRDSPVIETVIYACTKAKARVVEKDFKEKGIRAYLNLGHTFGHALESVAGLGDITHGEGVAWGMSRAADLSLKTGLCSKETAQRIKNILSLYGYDTNSVPAVIKDMPGAKEKLIKAMHKDKKNNSNHIKTVLIKNIADIKVMETDDSNIIEVLN